MPNILSDKLYYNISNDYNPHTKYTVGNYCYYDGIIKKCTEAITDYSKTSAYAVGDYCYHDDSGTNNLYKCNTAISAPGEEWTVAHWTLTSELPTGKWISVVVTDEIGGGSVDLTCIAPAYEETVEYYANDIVLHSGKVYYCKGDSATGPWDPTEWIECPISKLLIYDAIAPIWSTQYTYSSGQWTTYRGHLYICAVETSTQGEFKDDEWYKISIDKTLHSMVHSIINWTAPWFNEGENYEKNAYVMHLADPADVSSARLYKAKYNLVAGAWAADDWEETTIVAMRNDLAYQKSITRNVWADNAVYHYGDIVMFKGKLCKAVVDNPTPGSFLNDEWDFTDTFTELNLTVGHPYVKGAGVTYNVGDIVQADGALYQALDTTDDTEPFKKDKETPITSILTATSISTTLSAMPFSTDQANYVINTGIPAGYVDIEYIGTVATVSINEKVKCTYSGGAFTGTLANGWGVLLQQMYGSNIFLSISNVGTLLTQTGDTATVSVISKSPLWEQVYIENTPIDHDAIASDFVAGSTYNVGDFVMHNNLLYKCNTAGTYATWDATKFTETKVTDELSGEQVWDPVASAYSETATYVVGSFVAHDNKLYYCVTAVETPEAFDSAKWIQTNIIDSVANSAAGYVIRNSVSLGAFLTNKAGVTVKRIAVRGTGMSYTGQISQHTNTLFMGERSPSMQITNFTINYEHNDAVTSIFKGCMFYNLNIVINLASTSNNFTAASPFTFFENCNFYNCTVSIYSIGDKYVPATKAAANRMSGFKGCSFYNSSPYCLLKITDPALYNSDYITGFDTCKDFVSCPLVSVYYNLATSITTLNASASIDINGNVNSNSFKLGASGDGISCIASGFNFRGSQVITGNYFIPDGSSRFKGTDVCFCDFGAGCVTGNYFNYGMAEMSIRIGRGCAFTGNYMNISQAKKILVLTDGTSKATGSMRAHTLTAHTISGNTIYYVPSVVTGAVAGDNVVIEASNLTNSNTHGVNIVGNNVTIYCDTNTKSQVPVRCISKLAAMTKFVAANNILTDSRGPSVTVTSNNTAFYNGDNIMGNVITGFLSAFEDEAGHTATNILNNIIFN